MILFKEATTEQHAEQIRQIRNTGRHWMTRHTDEISQEQQREWWRARDPKTCRIWLLLTSAGVVGYGLLRLESGQWWVSVAVLPEHQGNGHGTKIYRYLAVRNKEDSWAEILADNTRSIKAAISAGYHLAWMTDRHAVMKFWKHP